MGEEGRGGAHSKAHVRGGTCQSAALRATATTGSFAERRLHCYFTQKERWRDRWRLCFGPARGHVTP